MRGTMALGKRKYRMSSSTMKRLAKRQRKQQKSGFVRNVTRIATRVLNKKTETKYVHYSTGSVTLNQNTFDVFHLNSTNLMPARGDGDQDRDGDQIFTGSYYIRGLFKQNINRPNVTYRFVVCEAPADYTYTYSSAFHNVTNNVLLDVINKNQLKVLYTKTWKPVRSGFFAGTGLSTNDPGSASSGGAEMTFPLKIFQKYKRKVTFPTGTKDHTGRKLLLLVGCFDNFLTTDNTALGTFTLNISHYYKDY